MALIGMHRKTNNLISIPREKKMYKIILTVLSVLFFSSIAYAVPMANGDIYSFELGLSTSSFSFVSLHDSTAPGDIFVTFDGTPEELQAYHSGLIPQITESETVLPGGVNRVQITISSPIGTDLFPVGLTVPDTSDPLIRASYYLGYWDDPGGTLDLSETANVVFAFKEFLSNGITIFDEDWTDIWVGPPGSPEWGFNPWDGGFGVFHASGLTGKYIDTLIFTFDFKTVPEPATMFLFGLGLLGLAGVSRKQK